MWGMVQVFVNETARTPHKEERRGPAVQHTTKGSDFRKVSEKRAGRPTSSIR